MLCSNATRLHRATKVRLSWDGYHNLHLTACVTHTDLSSAYCDVASVDAYLMQCRCLG